MGYLPDARYLAALQRLRDKIAAGEPLFAVDSEEIGNKYTSCTWGLCTDDWPDPQDYMTGGHAVLYRPDHQPCPFAKQGAVLGCFYECCVFQGKEPTREEAIQLYDAIIKGLT